MNSLELKIPPFAVTLAALLLIWLSGWLAPGLTGASALSLPTALLLAVCGLVAGLAGVLEFRRVRTTVDPMHPERASAMVTSGIYARSRNPMYLGLALLVAAYAAWKANLIGGFVVPVFILYMNRFQIIPEERILGQKFGAAYRQYCARAGRWFQL